ncbi:MAG: M23 family metallopeptidase [Candidatus Harrisonbacteria bacterium]|nr:M23 family metallopeptidase [Candidatus Harrisonbacteria bacterium]
MRKRAGLVVLVVALAGVQESVAETMRVTINKTRLYQGDVLKIQVIKKSTAPFIVNFLNREYKSFQLGKDQTVLLGIHYQLKPGTYSLTGAYEAGPNFFLPIYYRITVKERFKPKKYFPPKRPPEVQREIQARTDEFQTVFDKGDLKPLFSEKFSWPLRKIYIPSDGDFGDDRCAGRRIKKVHCRYHTGTDFRAAFDEQRSKPEKVFAINFGRVVKRGYYPNTGNVLVIDHGAGIFSGYLHLSRFLVKEGDLVKRKQIIAVAGNTGTNSIHLHLFIRMNDGKTTVDPMKFLQLLTK